MASDAPLASLSLTHVYYVSAQAAVVHVVHAVRSSARFTFASIIQPPTVLPRGIPLQHHQQDCNQKPPLTISFAPPP